MLTVFDDRQLGQDGTELSSGRLLPSTECPRRAEVVLEALRAGGRDEIVAPDADPRELLRQVHTPDYLAFLEGAWERWSAEHGTEEAFPVAWPTGRREGRVPDTVLGALGHYSFAIDTPITAASWSTALAGASVACTAARRVAGGLPVAFALCRPPGHHAGRETLGGYCFLNNSALAVQTLREAGAERVAILDVDYHHGNGTQDIFYERGDVLTVSLHADPRGTFPYYWGHADEGGAGEGAGRNLNLPLPAGTDWDAYARALDIGQREIESFGAEALVIALGVDTFGGDPFSSFAIRQADFAALGRRLHTDRPTVIVLEGGYAVDELGANVSAVLRGFES